MSEYVLDHGLEGDGARLALMSRLLDPMHRRHLDDAAVDAFLARCADPEWWTQTIASGPCGDGARSRRDGRYWARTSDPQLVELVLSQLS